MFNFLLVVFQLVTVAAWILSTLYILLWLLDGQLVKKPYPLEETSSETRSYKYFNMWLFAPTISVIFCWKLFRNSTSGTAILAWLNEKI